MALALIEQPQNIKFIQQNADEVIELLLRRHPITNLPWIVTAVIALFLPFLILFADRTIGTNVISQLPGTVALELLIMYDLLVLAYVVESFLFWYFNIYIVTNQHLVEIKFDSLLSRDIIELQYDEIQTVQSIIKGIMRETFNFGTVVIETAAKDEPEEFTDVPQPDMVADRIRDIQQQAG